MIAISEHELKQKIKPYREWGSSNKNKQRAAFAEHRLIGADLSCCDMRLADFSGAHMSRAVMRGSDFKGANFNSADLQGADLSNSNCIEADFTDACLSDTNFSGAKLRNAVLDGDCLDLDGCIGNGREIKSLRLYPFAAVYTKTKLQIGCYNFDISDWWEFDDFDITRMGQDIKGPEGIQVDMWRQWKPVLKKIIELSPAV